jgi:hypothetical protein
MGGKNRDFCFCNCGGLIAFFRRTEGTDALFAKVEFRTFGINQSVVRRSLRPEQEGADKRPFCVLYLQLLLSFAILRIRPTLMWAIRIISKKNNFPS